MVSGACWPMRRLAYSRQPSGVCTRGSIGCPAASASRCVQVRATTWSGSYPAAGQQPAAAGGLVRQPVDHGVRHPLRVDRQVQVGQRIEPVRVAAVLADQDVRAEGAQQVRHHGVEGPQPAGVRGPSRQGHVDRGPLRAGPARFRRPPGAGPQRRGVLVQADRQHPRIVVEGGLHPVAVMHVDADVGDPVAPWLSSQWIATARSPYTRTRSRCCTWRGAGRAILARAARAHPDGPRGHQVRRRPRGHVVIPANAGSRRCQADDAGSPARAPAFPRPGNPRSRPRTGPRRCSAGRAPSADPRRSRATAFDRHPGHREQAERAGQLDGQLDPAGAIG